MEILWKSLNRGVFKLEGMAEPESKPEALVGLFNLFCLPSGTPETSETVPRIQDALRSLEALCGKNDFYTVPGFLNQGYQMVGTSPRYLVHIVFLTTPWCVDDLDNIYHALFSQPLPQERYLLAVSDDVTLRTMARAITLGEKKFPEDWILYTHDLEMYLAMEILPRLRPSGDAFSKQLRELTDDEIERGVDVPF